jgi:tetratricopeptide (TPR) repeat protein
VTLPGLCRGEDQNRALTVKKISFARDKGGSERIVLFCNQSCVPAVSSIEEENPRIVMDMTGVSLLQAKARNFKTGGKLVKMVRSYLNKETDVLRVVLDMDPSNHYIVRPVPNPSRNTYALTIRERGPSSERKPGDNNGTDGSHLSPRQRITIQPSDLRPGDQQEAMPRGATPGRQKRGDAAVKDVPSVDRGRSQLNAGEFAAAADTFTRILAAHPQDSLSYRLRGNAYDNLGDRQKAVEDWKQAARLGDATLQSYLDFLQVMWREDRAP